MRRNLAAAILGVCLLFCSAPAHAEWRKLGNLSQPIFKKVRLNCSQRLAIGSARIALPFSASGSESVASYNGGGRFYAFELQESTVQNEISSTALVLGSIGLTSECSDWAEETGSTVHRIIATFQIGANGENGISLLCESGGDTGALGSSADDSVLKLVTLEQDC